VLKLYNTVIQRLLWFFISLIFLVGVDLKASNFHEHLQSLPFPRNFAEEADAIFAIPDNVQLFLNESLGFIDDDTDNIIRSEGLTYTLSELCETLDSDKKVALEKLLSFDDGIDDIQLRRATYKYIETLRKNILLALSPEVVERIFERYFNEEPLCNREVISATMTRRFFEPSQRDKHTRLYSLAKRYGTELYYNVALQRKVLLKDGVVVTENSQRLLEKNAIKAIDVVGSIGEGNGATNVKPLYSQGDIEQRLRDLFEYASEHSTSLVLHAFEAGNEGVFYDALRHVITSYTKPLKLEFGHVAYITEDWADIIISNPYITPCFHANIQSNRVLCDVSLVDLHKKVKALQNKEVPVFLGSDGRGILAGSSYHEQSKLLDIETSGRDEYAYFLRGD